METGATQEASASNVRGRIFASALKHFSAKGYAATSLREICEDAGTTKPMVYYYFGAKEDLYVVILREIMEQATVALNAARCPAASAEEQVLAYCRAYVAYFLGHEGQLALVLRQVFVLGGQPMAAFLHALAARVRHPLDQVIRAGIRNGEFIDDDVERCAMSITGILNMFILAHVFGNFPLDDVRPVGQVEHFLAGMRRRSAP